MFFTTQQRDGVSRPVAQNHHSFLELATPLLVRMRDIRQVQLRVQLDMPFQIACQVSQCAGSLGGKRDQLPAPARTRRRDHGRLFHDDVDIGTADAESIHASQARLLAAHPRPECRVDEKGTINKVDFGIGSGEMQRRRNHLVLHRLDDLNQARHAGGPVEMTKVALDRSQRAERPLLRAKPIGAVQRRYFDRVAQFGRASMRFEIGDRLRMHICNRHRSGDDLGLAIDAGGSKSRLD